MNTKFELPEGRVALKEDSFLKLKDKSHKASQVLAVIKGLV